MCNPIKEKQSYTISITKIGNSSHSPNNSLEVTLRPYSKQYEPSIIVSELKSYQDKIYGRDLKFDQDILNVNKKGVRSCFQKVSYLYEIYFLRKLFTEYIDFQ